MKFQGWQKRYFWLAECRDKSPTIISCHNCLHSHKSNEVNNVSNINTRTSFEITTVKYFTLKIKKYKIN